MKYVVLAAIAALGIGWLNWHHAKVAEQQNVYGLIASALAGRDVHVHCQSSVAAAFDTSGEAGTVQFDAAGRPADSTNLMHGVCDALSHFKADLSTPQFQCVVQNVACDDRSFQDVQAVHTLAHESAHLSGLESESQAECRALQTTAFVAQRLGADDLQANAVAQYAYRHLYPNLPAEYQSAGCYP